MALVKENHCFLPTVGLEHHFPEVDSSHRDFFMELL